MYMFTGQSEFVRCKPGCNNYQLSLTVAKDLVNLISRMHSFRSHIIGFNLLLLAISASAQGDLTGTWEGIMGRQLFQNKSGQFLQVNIIQQGDKICGYTCDSVIAKPGDHCKAMFEGKYDKRKGQWELTGTSFIENSGSHVFMRIILWNERRIGKDRLEGEVGLKSWPVGSDRPSGFFGGIFRVFGIDDELRFQNIPEEVQLKRISSKSPEMPAGTAPCFPHLQKPTDSVNAILATIPVKDSLKQVVSSLPVAKKNDTLAMVQKMTERRRLVFSHLPVDVKNITLNIYDNAIVDGDTVTVFYNDKLIVDKKLLSEKPIVIELALDENSKTHEIVLYAENLGSIPPNTALIVVNAGNKRYELHASSNLEENAVLVLEYIPK